MAYVRGHYRSDGTYVRPHHRRTRPASARPARPVSAPRRVKTTVTRAYPASTGQATRVRSYYRSDGTYVRGHHRLISRPAAVAAGGGGVLLLILLLLALTSGGTGNASTPDKHPTPSISVSDRLSRQ